MRKFIFLISFLLLPLACISVSGWVMESAISVDEETTTGDAGKYGDTLAKNYFPLNTGNSWTDKFRNILGDTVYHKVTVLYDTIVKNNKYYRLSEELPFFKGTLIALDSSNGNLYGYKGFKDCAPYRTGVLLDSLGSKRGDKIKSCSSNLYGRCMDTADVNLFGVTRKSKFFLSPEFSGAGVFNRFTENIGISYAFKIENFRLWEARLMGCVINNVVHGDTNTTTHIFGTVIYEDNNQPASNGYVKALQLNRATGGIITLDSVQIQPGGHYYFRVLPNDNYYIVAYPNSEENCDYVPTYFPSTINWQNSERVNTGNNPENVKISVYRKTSANGTYSLSGKVSSQINQISTAIKGANVYIKQGNIFRTFSITQNTGQYKLSSLASGNFEIIVDRLGYVYAEQNIAVNNSNLNNINFFLQPTFIKIISSTDNTPKSYKLNQNYPNPFNPVTNIRFDIPKSSFVKLIVYNVTGKQTGVLINEIKSAGSYEVDFNAGSLSSGIYFYRLETDEFIDTKKMIVIK